MHTTDLVDRLIAATEAAIRNEAPTLAHDPNGLRGLVLDVTIANGGAVLDVDCHVTRRKTFRADAASRVPLPVAAGR